MASEQGSLKPAVVQGLFGIAGAVIGAAGTLGAAWLGKLPEPLMPPSPSPTATVTVTATPEPVAEDSRPSSQVEQEWIAELEPLTEEGLWQVDQAKIRNQSYLNSLVVPTEWGNDSDTSWRDYALNSGYSQLTGSVGIVDGGHDGESAQFQIMVDGRVAFQKQVKIGEIPAEFSIDVTDANDLRLQVTDTSDNTAYLSDAVFADLSLE